MAQVVKTIFRSNPQGAGADLTGAGKQAKQLVVAEVTDSDGGGTNGIPFTAKALGLRTIDFISFDVLSYNAGSVVPATGVPLIGNFDRVAGLVWVHDDAGTPSTDNAAVVFRVLAFGDSAFGDELL
jgi:hypothetical protein